MRSAPRSRSPWKRSRSLATWAVKPDPFGIAGESFENPVYLDKLVDTLGGEPIPIYETKAQCCGCALNIVEPDKPQEMIKGIVEAAVQPRRGQAIVTPCPVCQMNVEVNQDETYNTKFAMPVVYYSTLMAMACGRSAKDAALDGQVIPTKKLDLLASKETSPAHPRRKGPLPLAFSLRRQELECSSCE
jgi:heterodisulfide reductase subunit B